MKKYIHRQIESSLLQASKEFPSLVLTGARQTGKTTLLKKIFPEYRYVTFDDPIQRKIAIDDPLFFLEQLGRKAIIDEVQYVPQILSYIKMDIDKNRSQNGKFILTGSQVFPLMSGLTESLAGRVALFELFGISFPEFHNLEKISREETYKYILKGFYPDSLIHKVNHIHYYRSYLQTYLERDIRQVTSVHDLKLFQDFLELLAARVGSLLNLNEVSKECGVSFTTAKRWLSLLETTNIVYLLRPYHKNISKRIVKSPKLYFTDTGLLSYLLHCQSEKNLIYNPLAGSFFENLVVIELLKYKYNNNGIFELYFYRDSHNNEIDIVIEYGNVVQLFEVKSATTIRLEHIKTIQNYIDIFHNARGFLLTFYEEEQKITKSITAIPWYKIYEKLK